MRPVQPVRHFSLNRASDFHLQLLDLPTKQWDLATQTSGQHPAAKAY